MVKRREIMELVNRRVGHILDAAKLGLPEDKFAAFRKIVLREFGDDELAADIERALARSNDGKDGNGMGRN